MENNIIDLKELTQSIINSTPEHIKKIVKKTRALEAAGWIEQCPERGYQEWRKKLKNENWGIIKYYYDSRKFVRVL